MSILEAGRAAHLKTVSRFRRIKLRIRLEPIFDHEIISISLPFEGWTKKVHRKREKELLKMIEAIV
jgi:hypothetical protein